MSYADREGECAVRIAREALDAFVLRRARRPVEIPNGFEEKSGAFVTLNDHPGGLLRGCIGYPQPFFPLVKSIEKGAEGAAEDPRFPRLSPEELDQIGRASCRERVWNCVLARSVRDETLQRPR